MTKFDDDTALNAVGSEGTYEGRVSPDWSIVRGANGGHIAAILLRGMVMHLSDGAPSRRIQDDASREPRSLHVHFMRVPRNEPFQVVVNAIRSGRTVSNLEARLIQDDKPVAFGLAIFSAERNGPEFDDLAMPEVPHPDAIDAVPDRPDFPFGQQFDFLNAVGDLAERSERAELGVWMRLREPRVVDHLLATQLLDAFAPAVFAKLGQGGGGAGVPTVEMTWHFRESLPVPGDEPGRWHLGVFRSTKASGGFVSEDGWLWNESGTLVAQSRQLAIVAG